MTRRSNDQCGFGCFEQEVYCKRPLALRFFLLVLLSKKCLQIFNNPRKERLMIADECILIDRFGAIMTVGRIPYNFSNDSSRRSLVQAYGMRNTIFSLFTFR